MDSKTTFGALKTKVAAFTAARKWEKFHDPKNLSMSIAIEAAELMEHYQWLTSEASQKQHLKSRQKKAIENEIADVALYILALCNRLQIDLASAIERKMKLNAKKYPVGHRRTKLES